MARRQPALDTMTRRPHRTFSKNQARRKPALGSVVIALLLALFVTVGVIVTMRIGEYRAARHEYAAYRMDEGDSDSTIIAAKPESTPLLAQTTNQPVPVASPTARPFHSIRVANLIKENRDTVGWLNINGTDMQYPIVQGSDNSYYMTRTFTRKRNDSGAIFMDCWNTPAFTDFNTVIYGHNMKDGSMFNGLREYRDQQFFDKHPFIEVTLLNRKLRYRVFAAYTSQGEEQGDFRGQTCNTEVKRSDFIKAVRRRSEVTSSCTVSRHDRLLTLVTCTSGTNPWFWVVHAVLVEAEF